MKKLLVILSLAAMTNVSIASVEQITLSNPPAGTKTTSYSGIGRMTPIEDLNKDGIGDFAISGAGSATGPVVVIYGSSNLPTILDLKAFSTGGSAGQSFNVSHYDCSTGTPSTPYSTIGLDANGDGFLDLASIVSDGGAPLTAVVLYGPAGFNQNYSHLQHCPGSYSYAFPTTSIQGFVADVLSAVFNGFEQADFNKDGKDDLLVTSTGVTTSSLLLLFGASDTTYQNHTLVPALVASGTATSPQVAVVNATSPRSAALGDTNGDKISDILVGTFSNSTNSVVRVYYGSSAYGQSVTGLTAPSSFDSLVLLTGGTVRFAVSAGDVTGDGLMDMMVGNSGSTAPDGGLIYVVEGKNGGLGTVILDNLSGGTSGGFTIHGVSYPTCNAFQAVRAGDMDGDGFGDIAVVAPRSGGTSCGSALYLVYIVRGRSSSTNVFLNDTSSFDGYVVLNDETSGNCPNATACSFANGGNQPLTITSLGDIDGDGRSELALGFGSGSNSKSYILSFKGTNTGTTTTIQSTSASSVLANVLAVLF